MNAARAYSCLIGLLSAVLLSPETSSAVEKPADLSSECVAPQAKKNIDECPAGPSKFNVEKKRAVAFQSAPPPRELKKREDSAKPGDAGTLESTAYRDQRETRLKARARALLITEIQGLERLLKQTKKNSPDRPQLVRRLAEGYVELEAAAVRDEIDEHVRNGEKILIDITAAQRNLLDQKLKSGQVSKADSQLYGVVNPDEEHVLWPWDGEFWRDELGFYRQVVLSTCGR